MLTGLYSAATGINAAQLNQHVIAENLAYVDMPGYRRQTLGFQTFEMELARPSEKVDGGRLGTLEQPIHRDFSTGHIQLTQRELDVAIDGEGFFAVETPQGVTYTRNGVFQVDQNGLLQTTSGYPILTTTGGQITIPPEVSLRDVTINREGMVFAGTEELGQLQVSRFADNQRLEPIGVSLFRPPADMAPEPVANVNLQQGYRELSNVSATTELVRMLVGVRHHESAQRALTSLSELLQKRING